MPPGDAQRVWFPEMLAQLRERWSEDMSWQELAAFNRSVFEVRRRLRRERGLEAPRHKCPQCGRVGRSELKGITIRSTLFALLKASIIQQDQFATLDRSWKKHRRAADLDPYGAPNDPRADPAQTCDHTQPAGQQPDEQERLQRREQRHRTDLSTPPARPSALTNPARSWSRALGAEKVRAEADA